MIEQLTDGDVVVVGGGPARLNGALMQARARCTVVVITGAWATAQINADLVAQETRQAVEMHRVRLDVGAGSRDG